MEERRNRKAKRGEREIRSSLLIIDLKFYSLSLAPMYENPLRDCRDSKLCFSLFLVIYAEGRSWWLIQKPQPRNKEESERLRGERDQIEFIPKKLLLKLVSRWDSTSIYRV